MDFSYDLQAETDEEGNCTGFVGVFSDVTALRRLERERVDLERGRRSVNIISRCSEHSNSVFATCVAGRKPRRTVPCRKNSLTAFAMNVSGVNEDRSLVRSQVTECVSHFSPETTVRNPMQAIVALVSFCPAQA